MKKQIHRIFGLAATVAVGVMATIALNGQTGIPISDEEALTIVGGSCAGAQILNCPALGGCAADSVYNAQGHDNKPTGSATCGNSGGGNCGDYYKGFTDCSG